MYMDTITLEMDETRELRWTFSAIKGFEKRGREILRRLEVKNERGLSVANGPMHAGMILGGYIRISDIMEAAVAAATGLSGLDGKKGEPSEAATAIDSYLTNGGSLEGLQQALFKAYQQSNDPSSIAPWEEALAREEEMRQIAREKVLTQVEISREELRASQEKLRKLSGGQPTQ